MKSGKELLLQAAKKELERLSAAVEKARKEVTAHMEAPVLMLDLHNQLAEIMNAGKYDAVSMRKIEDLDRRYKEANKAFRKDFCKLLDKRYDAEQMHDDLATEIVNLEFILGVRKAKK